MAWERIRQPKDFSAKLKNYQLQYELERLERRKLQQKQELEQLHREHQFQVEHWKQAQLKPELQRELENRLWEMQLDLRREQENRLKNMQSELRNHLNVSFKDPLPPFPEPIHAQPIQSDYPKKVGSIDFFGDKELRKKIKAIGRVFTIAIALVAMLNHFFGNFFTAVTEKTPLGDLVSKNWYAFVGVLSGVIVLTAALGYFLLPLVIKYVILLMLEHISALSAKVDAKSKKYEDELKRLTKLEAGYYGRHETFN